MFEERMVVRLARVFQVVLILLGHSLAIGGRQWQTYVVEGLVTLVNFYLLGKRRSHISAVQKLNTLSSIVLETWYINDH